MCIDCICHHTFTNVDPFQNPSCDLLHFIGQLRATKGGTQKGQKRARGREREMPPNPMPRDEHRIRLSSLRLKYMNKPTKGTLGSCSPSAMTSFARRGCGGPEPSARKSTRSSTPTSAIILLQRTGAKLPPPLPRPWRFRKPCLKQSQHQRLDNNISISKNKGYHRPKNRARKGQQQ